MSVVLAASDLRGVFAALPTPIDDQSEIDFPALQRVVDYVCDGGVHGVWALGSGGEFACVETAGRERLLAGIVEAVAGRVPVIAGSAATTTGEACRFARDAYRLGASAVSVMAPYYYACSPDELERHFRTVRDATPLPAVLYNNPWNTRTPLPLDLVAKLASEKLFLGIKDSSCDFDCLLRFVQQTRAAGSFAVLQGNELALGPAFLMGADGAVVALPAIAPKLCVSLYEAARLHDLEAVRKLQQEVAGLFRLYLLNGRSGDSAFLAGQKAALEILGLCSRRTLASVAPATDSECDEIRMILAQHGLLVERAQGTA